MSKILKKLSLVLIITFMVVGSAQFNTYATENNDMVKVEHNLSSKQVPYIYYNGEMIRVSNTIEVPKSVTSLYVYYLDNGVEIDTENTTIYVNGEIVKSQSYDSGSYKFFSIDIPSSGLESLKINFKYEYKRDFTVRARKILSTKGDESKMEDLINKNPASYSLYNDERSIELSGTINTAIDSDTNFVHWTQVKGVGNYIGVNDTYVKNLPDGHYTLIETDPGGELVTIDAGSTSGWLQSSGMKENKDTNQMFYNFTVNDDLINEWMHACVFENQGNSLFYGFYTQEKPKAYSIIYDGNDNDRGEVLPQLNQEENSIVQLNDNKYIRDGYSFVEWNTVANPTESNPGTAYQNKERVQIKNDLTLYAQWKKNKSILQSVYLDNRTDDNSSLMLLEQKTTEDNNLAYQDTDIQNLIDENLIDGYKHIETIIEVKKDDDQWSLYENGMKLDDGYEVRFVIAIDRDMEKTKTLTYQVEYYLEGNDEPSDIQLITNEIWVHDTTNSLKVMEIENKEYEGYIFSHYTPETLPEYIENGGVIKVFYNKIIVPIIPEDPDIPDVPDIPIIPTVPVVPPIQLDPIIPVTPNNPVVRNNPIIDIEDNEIPLDNNPSETIKDNETPLASKPIVNGAWALINLICTLGTVILGVLFVFQKNKKEDEVKNSEEQEETIIYKRHKTMKVLMILVAIISVVVFVLTENITLPMIMVDKWTLLMVVILIIQAVVVLLSRRWKKDDDNQSQSELKYES